MREVFREGEGSGCGRVVVGGGGFFRKLEAGVADDVQEFVRVGAGSVSGIAEFEVQALVRVLGPEVCAAGVAVVVVVVRDPAGSLRSQQGHLLGDAEVAVGFDQEGP